MNKIFNFMSMLIVFILIGMVIIITYWSIRPYNVIEFNTETFPIINDNKTVEKGSRLIYEIDSCKKMDITPELSKFFVDGLIYEVSNSIGAIDVGCSKTWVDTYVPVAIPTGSYRLKLVSRYQVNPIRHIQFVHYTEPFKVVERGALTDN